MPAAYKHSHSLKTFVIFILDERVFIMSKVKTNLNLAEMGAAINVEELARVLKISKTRAYELVKMQGFPVLKLGKRILVPTEALVKWLNANIGRALWWVGLFVANGAGVFMERKLLDEKYEAMFGVYPLFLAVGYSTEEEEIAQLKACLEAGVPLPLLKGADSGTLQ